MNYQQNKLFGATVPLLGKQELVRFQRESPRSSPVFTSKAETGVEQKAFFFQVSNMFTPVQFGMKYETQDLCFIIDFKARVCVNNLCVRLTYGREEWTSVDEQRPCSIERASRRLVSYSAL